MYQKIQLPKRVLDAADKVTLADLLSCPSAQVWFISALGNVARFKDNFEVDPDDEQDAMLEFALQKLQLQIPAGLRQQAYAATCELIRTKRDKENPNFTKVPQQNAQ